MKILKLILLLSLVFTLSCEEHENLTPDQELTETLEDIIDGAEDTLNDIEEEDAGDDDESDDNTNEDGDDSNDENDDTSDDDETESDNEEETPSETIIDCSVFDGVFEFSFRDNLFAGVKTLSIHDIDPSSVKWTIDGTGVTPRSPRFVYLKDHIQDAGLVEVCYEATSETCGVLSGCITVNFQP